MTADSLINGKHWCEKCRNKARLGSQWKKRFEKIKTIINAYGGKLLAVEEKRKYLQVECKKGHKWRINAHVLLYDSIWCTRCKGYAKTSLEDLDEVARKRDAFYCVPTVHLDSWTKVRWRCKHGHVFESAIVSAKSGKWCPTCGRMRKSILASKRLAQKLGGQCLSEVYEGPHLERKIAEFECHRKHRWKMSIFDVRGGHWCPECARSEGLRFQRKAA